MKMKYVLWGGLGIAILAAVGFAGWILSLPPTPEPTALPPVSAQETAATLAALKPPKRVRPVVAIIGINDATETTDYLMPYGILRRADVADVFLLSTEPGPVRLYPALRVQPDATVAEFDQRYPEGADYIIVPAMSRADDIVALDWIRRQADGGATVISVCAGAIVAGAAGLLDGRRATTHWYYLDDLRENNPTATYVPGRRLIVDRGVATTTGISASMPMMLTLIEAVAGRQRAETVASELGVADWDERHDSNAFKLTRPFATTVLRNVVAFWNREQFGIELVPGMDEVSLALVADAWSRTYRSRALTVAANPDAVETRNGLRLLPDRVAGEAPDTRLPAEAVAGPPARALDEALDGIERRYGARTSSVVAMQLEYHRQRRLH